MSNQVEPNIGAHRFVAFKKKDDGSIIRGPPPLPEKPASADPTNPLHLSKDIVINQTKNTWARLFVPRKSFESDPGDEEHRQLRVPIVVYFHGGGFIICSPATVGFYNIYDGLTTDVGPAIVVSVKYRLAPEHRLPAAYDDAMEALHWLKNSSDEWLIKYGDVSRCYLMGSSAGGNICYHVGLRAASCPNDLKPLQIKGLILHQPAFGGQKRSESEVRLMNDKILPLVASDMMWNLSLPVGSDRDHEYSNPTVWIKKEIFDEIKLLGWKILIMGCNGDPLVDRQIELAKKLEELGVTVVTEFQEEGFHGSGENLINLVKQLIQSP